MPLVGGGGAPNVAGGNPSGTGTTLNYIGEHVYANSGAILVDQSNPTLLDFTTAGTHYIVADIQMGQESTSGDDMRYQITFNGEVVMGIFMVNPTDVQPFQNPLRLIIPPLTRVQINADNLSSNTGRETYAVLTGRVY